MQKSCSPFKFNKRYFPKGNDWLKWKVDESKLSEKNKKVLEQIRNNHTCFVHVRRGDYLASNYKSIFEGCCTLEYYKKALKFLQDKYKDIKFICFSDDLQWMKQNLPLGDNATFVDWNTGKNSPLDMYLMSQCDNAIIANSSFSYWGHSLVTRKRLLCIHKDGGIVMMEILICFGMTGKHFNKKLSRYNFFC